MEFGNVFQRIAQVLRCAEIPYMLTGSFAASYYGVLRSTHDIDIVIAPSPQQLNQLVQDLQSKDYYADQDAALEAFRRLSMFNAIDNQTGWKIDFIFSKNNSYAREALHRRTRVQFQNEEMFVATAEDVVVSKLQWTQISESARQLEDVAALLKHQRTTLDLAYIEKWVTELGLSSEWANARQAAGF